MVKRLEINVPATIPREYEPVEVAEKVVPGETIVKPVKTTRGIKTLQHLSVVDRCPEGVPGHGGAPGNSSNPPIPSINFVEYTTTVEDSYMVFDTAIKKGYRHITIKVIAGR